MNHINMPRRIVREQMTPEELAIGDLMGKIESLGAHPLLTDVVILLSEAKEKLADWVDMGVSSTEPTKLV